MKVWLNENKASNPSTEMAMTSVFCQENNLALKEAHKFHSWDYHVMPYKYFQHLCLKSKKVARTNILKKNEFLPTQKHILFLHPTAKEKETKNKQKQKKKTNKQKTRQNKNTDKKE